MIMLVYNRYYGVSTDAVEITLGTMFLVIAGFIFLILTLFFFVFFRDPERQPPAEGITAPADGIIKSIETEKYEGKQYNRIVTFMNINNVHVNRVPIDGKIISITRREGGYLPAYKPESKKNNQVETVLETEIGRVSIIQIVGIFARRIEMYLSVGDEVKKGDRLGIIKFGSRVDLLLPKNRIAVKINPGKKVQANQTTFAEIKK